MNSEDVRSDYARLPPERSWLLCATIEWGEETAGQHEQAVVPLPPTERQSVQFSLQVASGSSQSGWTLFLLSSSCGMKIQVLL